MPVSEAKKRANEKYSAKTYKTFSAKIKIADYYSIDNYCKTNNISKAKILVKAFNYYIENNNNPE
ncbi:MAG: hypothetical protein FWG90_04365 [Oscillospiraceae bacterium]|nr:hypothetical protein [Oscillospiraceae bacterium]